MTDRPTAVGAIRISKRRMLNSKYSRHFSYVECNDISTRSIRSFDNLFLEFNVSLPLVTGELLQKTVDVSSVTYKLYNIKTIIYVQHKNNYLCCTVEMLHY